MPVFYATDRAVASRTPLAFGADPANGGTLSYGRFDVSVPRDHRLGGVERPTIWTLYIERRAAHFVILSRRDLPHAMFFSEVRDVVGRSIERELFVFVHGFNVAFEDAIYRTAQIAYDLGIDGAPILYSWPSEGSVVRYNTDQVNNRATVPHLRGFLEDVLAQSGAAKIHLVAHSMGNRALVQALASMRQPAAGPRFRHVALTAPDIDVDVFRNLAQAVANSTEGTTLYVSDSDKALQAARAYGTFRRLGDAASGIFVADRIDTIDVSGLETGFLSHSYYGDNRSVITDLFQIIRNALPPDRRGLVRAGAPPGLHWAFRR